jgi:hypothetical protein
MPDNVSAGIGNLKVIAFSGLKGAEGTGRADGSASPKAPC